MWLNQKKKRRSVSADDYLSEENLKFEDDSKVETNSTSDNFSVYTEDDESLSTVADVIDDICINLSIESVDSSMRVGSNCDEELQIYTQVSSQITKMLQAVLIYNETEEEVIFDLDQTERVLHVAKITGDGNCLFRALAHQLLCQKLDSAIQNKSTKKLWADVVRYINENFAQFTHELKGCVFDLKTKNEIDSMENECHSYVDHILSKDGSWGGSESIKAVSAMHSVNILLFNEFGSCYYVNGFNSEYNKTVAIAYRLECGSNSKLKRNHYDSVTKIRQDDLFTCSRLLSNEKRKFPELLNKTIDIENED